MCGDLARSHTNDPMQRAPENMFDSSFAGKTKSFQVPYWRNTHCWWRLVMSSGWIGMKTEREQNKNQLTSPSYQPLPSTKPFNIPPRKYMAQLKCIGFYHGPLTNRQLFWEVTFHHKCGKTPHCSPCVWGLCPISHCSPLSCIPGKTHHAAGGTQPRGFGRLRFSTKHGAKWWICWRALSWIYKYIDISKNTHHQYVYNIYIYDWIMIIKFDNIQLLVWKRKRILPKTKSMQQFREHDHLMSLSTPDSPTPAVAD